MIVGSGLIARGFLPHGPALEEVCIYAAGVSNSSCKDSSEFLRDRKRLEEGMSSIGAGKLLVYISTCSIEDRESSSSPYIEHKRALEELVRQRERHLIIRLPQTAGVSPNPHTLLNYLYARISRSERFDLWRLASRNVIDVEDAARIVLDLVFEQHAVDETINVANPKNSTMFEIVAAIEQATKHKAVYNLMERGTAYTVDTSRIAEAIQRCRIAFDETYLLRTIEKYYGKTARLRA